jgi:hypothetical protein
MLGHGCHWPKATNAGWDRHCWMLWASRGSLTDDRTLLPQIARRLLALDQVLGRGIESTASFFAQSHRLKASCGAPSRQRPAMPLCRHRNRKPNPCALR